MSQHDNHYFLLFQCAIVLPLSSRSCSSPTVYTPLITAQSLSSVSKCRLMYFLLESAISIFFVLFGFGLGRFSWLVDGFGSCLFMCSLNRWSVICSVSSRIVWRSFAISLVSASLSVSSCFVFWFCSWSFWMFFSVFFFGLLHFLAYLRLIVFRFCQLVDYFFSFFCFRWCRFSGCGLFFQALYFCLQVSYQVLLGDDLG